MEFTNIEEVKTDLQTKQKNQEVYNSMPDWYKDNSVYQSIQSPAIGKISDISYTGGFGNVYEKGWNGTYYAKYKNYLGADGNEDRLAKQQSGWEQAWKGVTKNIAKVGLYAADAVGGTIYGIGSAIRDRDMRSLWDNDISNALDYASKYLDRELPNYYTDEQKSMNFLQKLTTVNFLANDFLNGMAFIGGAVLPQLLLAPITGGASVAPSLAKLGAGIGIKSARNAGKTALRQAIRAGKTGATIGNSTGELINTAKFMVQSATFEAGMEARHNFHDSVEAWTRDYVQKNGTIPTSEETENYIRIAEKASNGMFYGNMALLSLTNATMFGKVFGLGSVKMPTTNAFNRMLGIGVESSKGTLKAIEASTLQKALGKTYFIGKKPFSEGVVEEGLQGVMGKMATTYTDAKYKGDDTYSFMQNLTSALGEQYGTKEGWNEIGVGMLVGMFGGNVSGNWGVSGIVGKGADTYTQSRNEVSKLVENANTQKENYINNFRKMNGANAMFINTEIEGENNNLESTQLFQDAVANISYIEANAPLKGMTDMVEDYNTMVDTLDITDEQLIDSGLNSREDFKSAMKTQFSEDLKMYESADRFVRNLGLDSVQISKGNRVEIGSALRASFIMGEKAEVQSQKIANNIEAITGESGVSSALRFFSELDGQMGRSIEQKEQQENNLNSLREEIIKIQADIQTAQADGNQNRVKQLSKKYTAVANQITQLTNKIETITTALSQKFDVIKANTLGLDNFQSVDNVLDTMKNLKTFSSNLRKMGRSAEANNLDSLVEQYNLFAQTALGTKLSFDEMTNTNFLSGKKAKSLFSSIIGESYEPTKEAIEDIKKIEQEIIDKAYEFGYTVNSVEEFLNDVVKSNTSLSEREKRKVEAIARILATQKAMEQRMAEASTTFNSDITEVVVKEAEIEDITIDSPNIVGDTVRFARKLSTNSPTTVEQIRALVDEIANLSNQIVNKPTSEQLAQLNEARRELETIKQQLEEVKQAPLENFTPDVAQTQQEATTESREEEKVTVVGINGESYNVSPTDIIIYQTEVGEINYILDENRDMVMLSDSPITPTDENTIVTESGQIVINFPQEVAQEIVDNILENINDTTATEQIIEDIIEFERASEFGDKTLADELENFLNRSRNGEVNINEVGEIFNRQTIGENSESSRGQAGAISTEAPNNEQVPPTDEQLNQAKQARVEEIENQISQLEDEIYELNRPFKFEETDEYKRYEKLLLIPEDQRTEEQVEEIEKLYDDINNWIFIMGAEVEGLDFAGLVEQMVALDSQSVDAVTPTQEMTEEEIDFNSNSVNKVNNQNLTTGLNFNAVTSVVKKRPDGTTYTEIANISLEDLEDITGLDLKDKVIINSETNAIQLDDTVVGEINLTDRIHISLPEEGSGTYYSPIVERITSMTDEIEYTPLKSNFDSEVGDNVIVDEDVYNMVQGDATTIKFDPQDEWNQGLLRQVKDELGIMTPIELEVEVEKQIKVYRTQQLTVAQTRLKTLLSADKIDKTKIKNQEDKIRDLIESQKNRIRNKLRGRRKTKLSEETKDKLKTSLKLMVANTDGTNVQVLKGSRKVTDVEKEDLKKIETLRSQLVDNVDFLIEAIETPSVKILPSEIKVKKVLVGFPNYRQTKNTDGRMVKSSKVIAAEDIDKIYDTGYILNGKLQTRTGIEKVDTTFVNRQINIPSNTKIPVVIIKIGRQNIAYPVSVGQDTPPVSETDMLNVYNNEEISNKEKAIRLNTLLVRAGVDTTISGNAFISVNATEQISKDFFNDKLAQVKDIVYIRSVDSFLDKSLTISDILVGNASINLHLSNPFFSPKIKFDFSGIQVKEKSNEYKREASKKEVIKEATSVVAEVIGKFKC